MVSERLTSRGYSRSSHAPCAVVHAIAAAILIHLSGVAAEAATAQPDIWFVSTRQAPHGCCDGATIDKLGYWRLDESCQWSPAERDAFRADDNKAVPTVVFIHGNRTDADQSIVKAWYAYQLILARAGGRPLRYIIWSWPADRVMRGRADVQLKVDYCDVESYYLAQWLDDLTPGVKVSLIGHSFGPRIIAGALHLLAGGNVTGRRMSEGTVTAWKDGRRNPVRAVMLAAAMNADWLAPGHCYGLALTITDQMLITCNPYDRALKRYPRLYGRRGPEAMGFIGPCGVCGSQNVELVCVSSRKHDWRCYCSAPSVCCRWAQYTFLDD